MEEKSIVLARIRVETIKKLTSVRSKPGRARGKRNVPDYYGSFIEDFTETTEFRHRQKESEVKDLRVELANKDFNLKRAAMQLRSQSAELEALKKQIANTKAVNE